MSIKPACHHNAATITAELMKTVDAGNPSDVLGHQLHITALCKQCGQPASFPSGETTLKTDISFEQAVAFIGGRPEEN